MPIWRTRFLQTVQPGVGTRGLLAGATYDRIASAPAGAVTPTHIGHLVFDVAGGKFYIATGMTAADWSLVGADGLSVLLIPGINGTPTEGQTLTAITGEYLSASAVSATVQWYRNGVEIAGADEYTYALVSADIGALITVRETATNAVSSVVAISNSVGPIAAAAVEPAALTAPTLSDTTPTEGQTITVTPGTYSGTAPITVARWIQANGVDVLSLGAGTSFVVSTDYVGLPLRVREVATNIAGSSANNFSSATSNVAAAAPAPVIGNQTFDIDETATIGAIVGTVTNSGGAAGTWEIVSGNTGGAFAISGAGVITVAAPLDFETLDQYVLGVEATNDVDTDSATITIDINDVEEGVGVLTSVMLDGTSQGGVARQYTTGMLFVKGDLMPSDDFSLRNASTLAALPTQIDPVLLWDDGSIAHAHVTVTATLAEGARLTCDAVRGLAGAGGADLSLATLVSGRTLNVTITPSSGSPITIDVFANLPVARRFVGPLLTEARVEVAIPSANFSGSTSGRLIVDVYAFANGDIYWDMQIANDKTLVVGGAVATYAASVVQDGNTMWSFSSQTHQQYMANCRVGRGTTSAGAVLPERPFVLPEIHYMGSTGLTDDFDNTFTLDASVASNLATILASPTYDTLKDRRGIKEKLGDSGDAGQIGWATYAQAAWMASNGTLYNAWRVARGWAEATPALWCHRYYAADVGKWIMPSFAPNFTSHSSRSSVAGTAWATAQGLPADQRFAIWPTATVSADHGHQGPWYNLLWLLEARLFYADGLAAQAAWSFTDPNARYTGIGTPDYDTGAKLGYGWTPGTFTVETQARSCGHDFRAIINAAKALPDDYPDKAGYLDLAKGQMAWLKTITEVVQASLTTSYGAGNFEQLGVLPFSSSVIGFAPYREINPAWQHDFIRKSAVDSIRAELPGHDTYAKPALHWLMRWWAEAVLRRTGTWNWKSSWRQQPLAAAPGAQRFATLDEVHAGNVAVGQIDGATWASSAYSGSGDYMRKWICLALQYLELDDADPDIADALARLLSERGNTSDQVGMPSIYDPNLANDPRVLLTVTGIRRSFTIAPTVRAGQTFTVPVANMAIGGFIGRVRTSDGLPRASTEDGSDAFEIDPTYTYASELDITPGGNLILATATPSVLTYTNIPVRAKNTAGVSSYVNIASVTFDAVAPNFIAGGPFSVADDATVGYVVATLTYTGTTITSVSIASGDTNDLFSVHIVGANTVELRVADSLAAETDNSYALTISGTNLVDTDTQAYTVNIVEAVSAPIITAAQAFTVEEGVDIGTLLTGNSGIIANTGGAPTSVSITNGNTGTRFAVGLNAGAIEIETAAAIALGDGSSYTLEITASNTGGNDVENVGVTVTKAAYIWNIPSSNVRAAYSVARRVRTTYTGPLIRVRRSSDNTEQNIGFSGGGNTLDESALATFVGANSGYVVTVYDQSPLAQHITQSTTSLQPRIVNAGTIERMAGTNTVPAAYFDAGTCLRNVTFTTGATSQFSAFGWITKRGENSGSGGDRIVSLTPTDGAADNSGQTSFMLGCLNGNQLRVSRNTANTDYSATTVPLNTARFIAGISSAIADYGRRLFVNSGVSTANTVAYTAQASSGFLTIGALSGGATSQAFDGHISELCLLSTLEPVTDLPAARTNGATFVGI